jgi:hypothetical protein
MEPGIVRMGRGFEILKLIAAGASLKDIAELLLVEDRDDLPGAHLEKTRLARNAELTRYMVENNLLDLDWWRLRPRVGFPLREPADYPSSDLCWPGDTIGPWEDRSRCSCKRTQ